jgi:hypothetical protein
MTNKQLGTMISESTPMKLGLVVTLFGMVLGIVFGAGQYIGASDAEKISIEKRFEAHVKEAAETHGALMASIAEQARRNSVLSEQLIRIEAHLRFQTEAIERLEKKLTPRGSR